MADIIYKLPNYITFLRLALIPLFVVLLIDPSRGMVNVATIIFIFAAITDYIDGLIARRWGAVSDFGKLFDPLADKILVISALVMLTSLRSDLYSQPWVPGWMVVMVLAREIWITGMRTWAASKGEVIGAGNTGKWKSFFQMAAIVCLLMHDYTLTLFGYFISYQFIGINLLAVSLAFSYISAFHYSLEILSMDFHIHSVRTKPVNFDSESKTPLEDKLN
jgi:CDP-diacylglycerol--glycerol-3-phosphate 3-phosphatidyltransferase